MGRELEVNEGLGLALSLDHKFSLIREEIFLNEMMMANLMQLSTARKHHKVNARMWEDIRLSAANQLRFANHSQRPWRWLLMD